MKHTVRFLVGLITVAVFTVLIPIGVVLGLTLGPIAMIIFWIYELGRPLVP